MLKSLNSLPISFKLMITTTLLLLFTVGLYGAMNVQNLVSAYDDSRTEQQELLLQAVTQNAKNVTALLAFSARSFIAATAYGDIQNLLDTLTEDDERLVYARVYDGDTPVATKGDPEQALANTTPLADSGIQTPEGVDVLARGGELHLVRVVVPFSAEGASGKVEIGRSIADIAERNARIGERVDERQQVAIINALFVGGMIILLGVVLNILQALRISRPIRELTESVERIAHGDLGERAVVDSTDEIGVLGRNFNYMAERLGILIKETEERATYEKEMEVARIIQESLLPPNRLIQLGDFQFAGFFKSASICGGDWWNFAEISDGRLLMLIGDVTGHGVSSAMITAAAKSCCDTLRHVTEGELTVTFLLEELNKTIYEAANRRFVMTFFATIIDPASRTLTFSNAGHNFPLLFRAKPADGEPSIVPLITRGNRLGDVMDSRFLERTVPYGEGDVIVWYTDGITEGLGKSGEEYGEKRFRRSIRSALGRPADQILDKILRDAEGYFEDFAHPEDDITLVVGKFTG